MKLHMEPISKATPLGRHSVMIMDGSGWHTENVVDEFDNVSLIKLPAYSPELNPIEQVWQWLRHNELANKCFEDYDDIVESCSHAWNSFISDIERVKNICFRDGLNLGD
jgi:transposase